MTTEIPLFPLRTVLFPGGALELRVFEPRYLDMVSRCLKTDSDFGVVGIRDGSEVGQVEPYTVGTIAQIVDWDRGPDGLLALTVTGRACFSLTATRRAADGLYFGQVELQPAEMPAALEPGDGWVLPPIREALAAAEMDAAALERQLDDANWLSFRLAEILPLTLAEKQAVLEADGAGARLALLRPQFEASLAPRSGPP